MTGLTEVQAGDTTARRDGHLDLLRTIALIGVVVYQWFGWRWTPIAIPFAAITFTIAGALIAASLDRSVAHPWAVLAKRMRRVVLPVWGLAVVAVPLLVWYGSAAGAGPGIGTTPGWRSMLLWVVPLFEPPSSAWGTAWTGSLWFVPAYLWLTALSPPLLWCFRRWPLRTAALPVLGLALALSGMWSPSGPLGEVMLTFALFGGYSLIGFAYHDNRIQTMAWPSCDHRVIDLGERWIGRHDAGWRRHRGSPCWLAGGQLALGCRCRDLAAAPVPQPERSATLRAGSHCSCRRSKPGIDDLPLEFPGIRDLGGFAGQVRLQPAEQRRSRSLNGPSWHWG